MTYEQALAQLYTKAEIKLIKTIKRKAKYGNATTYERSLLNQVQKQIKQLRKASDVIVQKLVKTNYKEGLDKLMQDIALDPAAPRSYSLMSGLNINQINIIVDNITSQFNKAVATVGRRCNDYIRQAALEATAKKLTTGQTVRQMQQDLQNKLVDSKITSVAYANGTEHNIKDYAAMVARTTTAETQNTAQVVQGNAWGYDLVRMTSHYPTCNVCAMYQGRVYALTKEAANGKYKGKNGKPLRFAYLYDTALVDGYNTIHPNCRHRFAIFPANAYTKDELAEFSRQSMQPFADLRSDTERKAYAREQAVKRKRNASMRQYNEVKQYLPDISPKTFAGWQRMKSANSQHYQGLMSDYRSIKKSVAKDNKGDIINFKDSNPYYKKITKDSIDNVPRLDVFNDEPLNIKYQEANKALLTKAAEYPVGTEISIVYDSEMNPIEDCDYVIGKNGSVKINNPNVPYHAIHNHPSDETFSLEDLMNFARKNKMLSITAVGNNGSVYSISKTTDNNSKLFMDFLINKQSKQIFDIDNKKYSYIDILRGKLDISALEQNVNLKEDIRRFVLKCIEGGEQYGFRYKAKGKT